MSTTTAPRAVTGTSAGRGLRTLVAVALLGAAVVHASVVSEHLEEWPAAGWFFALLVVVQVLLALLVARRLDRAVTAAVVTTSTGTVVLWLWSRATGLPFGPEAQVAEPVGLPDLACCALELVAVGLCVAAARGARRPHRLVVAVTTALLLATTVVGVQPWVGPAVHGHAR